MFTNRSENQKIDESEELELKEFNASNNEENTEVVIDTNNHVQGPVFIEAAVEENLPSVDLAIRNAILWGMAGSVVFNYPVNAFLNSHMENAMPFFSGSYLGNFVYSLTGGGIGNVFGMCITCNWTDGGFVTGVAAGIATGGLNYALQNMTGLPDWSVPLITTPVITTLAFLPNIIECSKNRFSFWHRDQPRSVLQEEQQRPHLASTL